MKRRDCLKTALTGTAGALLAPAIVPSSVLGKDAPSNKIHVGQIGCGRIARGHDLPEVMKYDVARVVAACDVDEKRVAEGKEFIEQAHAKARGGTLDVATHTDYRDLLRDPGIDAVVISTPDHWHAQVAMRRPGPGRTSTFRSPSRSPSPRGARSATSSTGRDASSRWAASSARPTRGPSSAGPASWFAMAVSASCRR